MLLYFLQSNCVYIIVLYCIVSGKIKAFKYAVFSQYICNIFHTVLIIYLTVLYVSHTDVWPTRHNFETNSTP